MSACILSRGLVRPNNVLRTPRSRKAGSYAAVSAISQFRNLHSSSNNASELATSKTVDVGSLDVTDDAVEAINTTSALGSGLLRTSSDAFLELPQILGGTSYAATIVLVTLLLRSSITLPMIAWQRRRVRRVQELVVPAAKQWMSTAKYALRAEFRKSNKSYEEYVATLNARAKKQFKALAAKYKCRPLPTMLLPPLIHLPIFIGTTLSIREACSRSFLSLQSSVQAVESGAVVNFDNNLSGLALESLAWCPSLADVDPYSALPVAVGVTALLNVEIQARIRQALAEARDNVLDESEGGVLPSSTPPSANSPTVGSDVQAKLGHKPTRPARPSPTIPSILQRKTFATSAPRYLAKSQRTMQETVTTTSTVSKDPSAAAAARSRAITNVLRFGSILFIPIAAASPVAVNVYWLTSNLFSLTQNLVLGYRDRSKENKREAVIPVAAQNSTNSSPVQVQRRRY